MEKSPEKTKHWEALSEHYKNEVGDKLGRGIDPLAVEAVVGLNALGYTTSGSCEGHLDRGTRGPYLDVHSREAELFMQKFQRFWEELGIVDIESQLVQKLTPDQKEKYNQLQEEKDRIVSKLIEPIQTLLDEFNIGYPYKEGTQFTYELGPEWLRIQPADIETQYQRTPEEQAKYLATYQDTLNAFGEFLKNKYYHQA